VFHANAHHDGLHNSVYPTAVLPRETPAVSVNHLEQNYPNPFNPSTTIAFSLADGPRRPVRLAVFDVTGALVRTLYDGHLGPGRHSFAWDGRNDRGQRVGSGVYFYRLAGDGGFTETRKMVLLK
jgi:flagellar hook assembly protein FlgD